MPRLLEMPNVGSVKVEILLQGDDPNSLVGVSCPCCGERICDLLLEIHWHDGTTIEEDVKGIQHLYRLSKELLAQPCGCSLLEGIHFRELEANLVPEKIFCSPFSSWAMTVPPQNKVGNSDAKSK